jgi:hypothetical protein
LDKTRFSKINIEKKDDVILNLTKFKEERLSGIPPNNIDDTRIDDGIILIFGSKQKDGVNIFNQIKILAKQLLDEEVEIEAKNKTVTVMVM